MQSYWIAPFDTKGGRHPCTSKFLSTRIATNYFLHELPRIGHEFYARIGHKLSISQFLNNSWKFVFTSLGVQVGLNDKNVFIFFCSRLQAFYQALAFQIICLWNLFILFILFISVQRFFFLFLTRARPFRFACQRITINWTRIFYRQCTINFLRQRLLKRVP